MKIVVDLYTTSEINNLVSLVVSEYGYPVQRKYIYDSDHSRWKYTMRDGFVETNDEIQPIHLSTFLYSNIYAVDASSEFEGAGYLTSEEYKNGWRKMIVKNPRLAYLSLDFFGEKLIRQIDLELQYEYDNMMRTGTPWQKECWDSFTTQKFWISQTTLIRRYHKLIDKLLKLSDQDLNYYVTINGSSNENSLLQNWLEENNLVVINQSYNKHPYNEYANDYNSYPGDLLLLTKRIYEDYPEWTPRKFLIEAKKFSNEVLELIDKNH